MPLLAISKSQPDKIDLRRNRLLTIAFQAVLPIEQKAPPRSQSRRPKSRRSLCRNLRSLPRPRQRRETRPLRPRLLASFPVTYAFGLAQQHRTRGRASGHRSEQTPHPVQGASALVLPQRRLGFIRPEAVRVCVTRITRPRGCGQQRCAGRTRHWSLWLYFWVQQRRTPFRPRRPFPHS